MWAVGATAERREVVFQKFGEKEGDFRVIVSASSPAVSGLERQAAHRDLGESTAGIRGADGRRGLERQVSARCYVATGTARDPEGRCTAPGSRNHCSRRDPPLNGER